MATKYAVYDAKNGKNIIYNTKEEALQAFWVNVVGFAKSHFHNTAYTVIETDENGIETWFNDNNQEINKPMTAADIEEMISFAVGLK